MNKGKTIEDKCIWFEIECKKAKLPYHGKCNGYNMPQCFAYLSVNKLVSQKLFNIRDLKTSFILNDPMESYKRISKKRKTRPINNRLRWEVLVRDNSKCQLCGISSDKALLHVDHIIPKSRGGKTELDNLRCLCSKCNIEKSDKLEMTDALKSYEDKF